MNNIKIGKMLEFMAVSALLFTFFGFFSVQIWDIDFWWHIASGKYILETGEIPSADPFGVFDANNVWGQTILKSQWLGQVMLYSVYQWFNLDGVIWLRASILTSCLFIVYVRSRISTSGNLLTLAITALSGLTILLHTGERPQLFSFLYISIVFLLLDLFSHSGKRWFLYCIPLVMLVWSNTHGGAVLGAVALSLYGVGYVLENRSAAGWFATSENRQMIVVVALGAATLILAPNGFTTFEHIIALESNPIRDRTSEYASTWSLWPTTKYYWLFIAFTLLSLPGFISKEYWKQGIVVFAIGAISVTAFRYIPLFVFPSAPYVAASLGRMLSRYKVPATPVNLAVLAITLGLLAYGFSQKRVFQQGMNDQRYPSGAVAFIEANNLGGRMFNTMNWGGYLIWHLSGRATMFVDGRMLDPTKIVPYTHILWVTPEGQRFFEDGNFNLVLIPYGNIYTGEKYPLSAYLRNHSSWREVYRDERGYLFARR